MTPSRKNTSRGKIRRRRQLRQQRQRSASGESEPHVRREERFVLIAFLKAHMIEVLCIMVITGGVLGVIALGPDRKAANDISRLMSSTIKNKSDEWEKKYPHGYKVIAFTEKEIIHTIFDKLPRDLEIDWKNLLVSRIQASQLKNTEEKIRIVMAGIHYAPAGVSDLTITTTLTLRDGIIAKLTQFGDLKFMAEIMMDDEGRLFCLFGLQ